MKLTLFKKQLLMTAVITTAFIVVSFLAIFVFNHFQQERMFVSPFASLARMVDAVAARENKSPELALADILRDSDVENDQVSLAIATGSDLKNLPSPELREFPALPYQAQKFEKSWFSPPLGEVIRLKSGADTYLVVRLRGMGPTAPGFGGPPPGFVPPPPGGQLRGLGFFAINLAALVISVILGSAVSIFLLFYKMREQANLADHVLSEMQNGNLKARFPVKRVDEAGQIMLKFNKMADEIEHLVDQLKTTESSRTRLLQELAHDLRTPIASLKGFVETLSLREDLLGKEDRGRILQMSLKEIDYFAHLVEDLLFLAQVKDPKYTLTSEDVNLCELLGEELERAQARFADKSTGKKTLVTGVYVHGDPVLLRRLFRNAFENAFSFANSLVEVNVEASIGAVVISVFDDGPGFSPESLNGFGEKKGTRIYDSSRKGRLSVGLGSVIMKAAVIAHQGRLAVANRPSGGAELRIELRAK